MSEKIDLPGQIGRVCLFWAALDRELNTAIQTALYISKAQAAIIATKLDNVAGRCDLIKSLSVTIAPDHDEWLTSLHAILDLISNKLAPERNRLIHDFWTGSVGVETRIDRRAKLRKLGAKQKSEIVFDTETQVPEKDFENLLDKILEATLGLSLAAKDFLIIHALNNPGLLDGQESQHLKKPPELNLQGDWIAKALSNPKMQG